MRKIGFFYLGPPKTASTWLFECLKEHPEICTTDHSETNYFDIYYARGQSWYDGLFTGDKNKIRIDCTPTYINALQPLERLVADNPEAKFSFGLRNPVDRAFSGYWHVKRRGDISYSFEDILDVYTRFRSWLEPGLISSQIKFLQDRVGKKKVLPILFDDVKTRPDALLKDVFDFIGIDKNFVPTTKDKPVNVARPKTNVIARLSNKISCKLGLEQKAKTLSGKKEYLDGVDPAFRARLNVLIRPEVEALSELVDIDLLKLWLEEK